MNSALQPSMWGAKVREQYKIAPHMEGNNADFALHKEGSYADFAPHMEQRHRLRDRKIQKLLFLLHILGSSYGISKHLENIYFEGEYL